MTPFAQVSTHLFLPSCAKQAEPTSPFQCSPPLSRQVLASLRTVRSNVAALAHLQDRGAAKYAGGGARPGKEGRVQKTRWAKESWAWAEGLEMATRRGGQGE